MSEERPYEKETKTIKRAARTGLWVAVGCVIVASCMLYSPWRVTTSAYTEKWMTIAGTVLTVLSLSMMLLTVRKRIPQLRQSESLDKKLSGYAKHVRELYGSMAAIIFMICLMTVISNQSIMLTFAMVSALVLILNFPNIYRVKVDLGLNDEEMRTIYGDRYEVSHEE